MEEWRETEGLGNNEVGMGKVEGGRIRNGGVRGVYRRKEDEGECGVMIRTSR